MFVNLYIFPMDWNGKRCDYVFSKYACCVFFAFLYVHVCTDNNIVNIFLGEDLVPSTEVMFSVGTYVDMSFECVESRNQFVCTMKGGPSAMPGAS